MKLEIVKRSIAGESYVKLAHEYFPTCNKYSKDGSIRKWVKAYHSGGAELLSKGAGRPKINKANNYINCAHYRIVPYRLSKQFINNPTKKQKAMIKKIKAMPKIARYKYIKRIADHNPGKFTTTALCKLFEVNRKIYYCYLKYERKPKNKMKEAFIYKN